MDPNSEMWKDFWSNLDEWGPSLGNWKGDLVVKCGMCVSVGRWWGGFWEIIRWALRGGRGGRRIDGETR